MAKTTTTRVPGARRSRLGTMLPGPDRLRRASALVAAVALMASAMAGMSALPLGQDLGLRSPAQAAVTKIPPNTGEGYPFFDSSGTYHWLGANADPVTPGVLNWCIEFGPVPIKANAQMADARELTEQVQRGDTAPSLKVAPAQMYWLLTKYEPVDTADSRAALAILAHANYDVAPQAAGIIAEIPAKFPSAYALAEAYAAESRVSTPQSFATGGAQREDAVRTGQVGGIASTNTDGSLIPGVPVTVTLVGPAVFDTTGTGTWAGVTGMEPISLAWTATGNGEVSYAAHFSVPRQVLRYYANDGSVQDMITRGPQASIEMLDIEQPGTPFRVHYDFQPLGTSQVHTVEVNADGAINDTLTTATDTSYVNPHWMTDAGQPVPVVYRATAYWSRTRPAQTDRVPQGAEKIGEVTATATGPDQSLEASLELGKRGFVTWVWEVRKADQGAYESYVAADWLDGYGLPEETSSENFDFRPLGTSHVSSWKVNQPEEPPCDTFTPAADPSYRDGEWTRLVSADSFDDGVYVPVVYTATAYRLDPEVLPVTAEQVPAEARALGSVKVTASGPGQEVQACLDQSVAPGFLTWVWQVQAEDQAAHGRWIASGWADSYGVAEETTSTVYRTTIDSSIQVHATKSGEYLSDDLFVEGFPSNHGDFEGGMGFKADEKEMTQSLLFFPDGQEVTEANRARAELIASVKVPARNGAYFHVGSTSFKVKKDDDGAALPGTYVFVTDFAGDDRTAAYSSSVEDASEQYVVAPPPVQPEIETTASDKAEGDKVLPATGDVTIADQVCQKEGKPLEVGKTYTLTARAMDKETGQPIMDDDGRPFTGQAQLTPSGPSDCAVVEVRIPARLLHGKTIVMFENVTLDGRTVAVHTDIEDEGQTVTGALVPEVGTTLTDSSDGDHEVSPGPVVLEDRVCPKNATTFEPGRTYEVQGRLMDKKTGKPLTGKEGQEVVASASFTPSSATDCAVVSFSFDARTLADHRLVAFERVYEPGSQVILASHEDLDDAAQTVHVIKPLPPLVQTGATVALVALAAAGLIGSGTVLSRTRR
ncbi:MAG: VaFE repeat-containing surface-anchored protein [Actinomyces urogenitalis]|uniref:VaFE repeat-containing surface-anchored protein n=1 Tax=Actinomyces urogenitalis TaxID=103621 RepID=UPI00290B7463|nr:VaFE repeat-containing surface-anchored protein [Actinomyces urogenitalis]MDU6151809.1 VaFE repeat-containing surface-anchored protein [Actinomyces urogenitalis]